MLEKIREGSQGFWAIVILGLVILSFVFAGVGGYITSSGEPAAATVNGEEISVSSLERAYQNERARMEAQYGEAFSVMAADENYLQQFRQGVLDRLIADALIEQAAADMGLRVSDEQVRSAVAAMPQFQIGGTFNNQRFQAILRQAGFKTSTFMDYMRREMTRQQVVRALLGSEFALKDSAEQVFALQRQTRDGRVLTVSAEQFKGDITLTDDELQAYYQENITQYDTQEQVKVAYVELMVSDIEPQIEVTEEQAEAYYADNSGNYRTEEERRASHILIEAGDDEDAAREKAEALLAQLQDGAEFAALASEHSDDTFSAENGGDLDWFGRGVMDPAFEDAVFALENTGDITSVVESAFGFHIIKLTDVKPSDVTPFAEVKDDIIAMLKRDKAIEEFYALQQRMEEVAFEAADSLEDVAAEVNKEVKTTELFTRESAPQPIASADALAAAFSEELVEEGLNSNVIEISDEHVLVLRVVEHAPERTKSLDEVRSIIEDALMADKAQQAAREWAESLMARISEGEDVSATLAEKGLNWEVKEGITRFGADIAPAAAEALFKLGVEDNARTVAELSSGDVAIVELTNIHASPAPQEPELAGLQQQLQSSQSQQIMTALIESLKNDAEIVRFN